jgi:maleylacetate reductase
MPTSWTHTAFTQQLHFGAGTLKDVPDLLKSLGVRRVLLVTTTGRRASDEGERVARAIGRALASTFDGVSSHLPTTVVEAAVRQARRDGVDGIVSFGGGSCIDLGKAVNHFAERETGTPGATYADRPALPHIAIPTTYSGAECTGYFGMTDERTRVKAGAGGPTCVPIAVVHDPELTLSTPVAVTAETSLNALAHCVEAAYSTARTPEAEAVALAGIPRIHGALPFVVDEPGDLAARTVLLEGAALAGRCLQNASMGAHHGLAQQLGPRAGISHGLANALVLPHVIGFNLPAVPLELGRVGAAMGNEADPAAAVRSLVERAGLPTRLRDAVAERPDLEALAEAAARNPLVARNPRAMSEADALGILEAVW